MRDPALCRWVLSNHPGAGLREVTSPVSCQGTETQPRRLEQNEGLLCRPRAVVSQGRHQVGGCWLFEPSSVPGEEQLPRNGWAEMGPLYCRG